MEVLEKSFQGIRKIIEQKKDTLLEEENIEVYAEINYVGDYILKVKKNNRVLYLGGKRDCRAHAINQINMLGKIVPYSPVIIIGMGNLYYLEELLSRTDETVNVLLYEPSFSVFYKQMQIIDINKMFRKRTIALVVEGINDDGVDSLLNTMIKGDKIPLMKHIILPNYEVFEAEKCKKILNKIVKISEQYQINVLTQKRFNKVVADNLYHNVQYIKTGYTAKQLDGVFPTDIPAIVVSAGPSLSKNIKLLKKAKNKAFIIAVDTALKPLAKAGIKPDMYAMLDGIKYLDLVETDDGKNVPLLTLLTGNKQILDYHKGKKFFVDEQYEYVYKIFAINKKQIAGIPFGGSVATLAFSLVCHLGFDTIVFVGQDLAYTGNKSHVDGAFKKEIKEEDTTNYMHVAGNYEETVPTLTNLNSYRLWFEDFIKEWKLHFNTRFINATEGGAKIEGTEIMTLQEVIDEKCTKEVNIEQYFEKLDPCFNKEEQKKIDEYLKKTPKKIQQIKELAKKGEYIYNKLEHLCNSKNMDKNAYLKILRRIKNNSKEIQKNENYQILQETMIDAEQIIRTSQYFRYDSLEEEGLEIARQGKKYMDLLYGYASVLENLTEEIFIK